MAQRRHARVGPAPLTPGSLNEPSKEGRSLRKSTGPRRPALAGQRYSTERSLSRSLPVRGLGVGWQEVGAAPGAPGPSWPSLCPLVSTPTTWHRTSGVDRKLLAECYRQAWGKRNNALLAPRVTLTGPKPRMKPAAPGAAAAVAAGTEHPKWRLPRPHHRYCRRRDP